MAATWAARSGCGTHWMMIKPMLDEQHCRRVWMEEEARGTTRVRYKKQPKEPRDRNGTSP